MTRVRELFYKCDHCGAVIDWYRGGYRMLSKHCGEGTPLPMKELYVVNSDRVKSTLDEAFKLLHCEEYEIAASVHARTNNVTLYFLLGRVKALVKAGRIVLLEK